MAAKLFGVPHSLLHSNGHMMRADAIMSGSNKVNIDKLNERGQDIQSTLNRVGLPKPNYLSTPRPVNIQVESEVPAQETANAYVPEPQFIPETTSQHWRDDNVIPEVATTWDNPVAEDLESQNEPEEPEPALTQAMNLITMQLETVQEDLLPQDDNEEEVTDVDAVTVESFQVLSLKQLRALCKHLGVPGTGNKTALIDRAMSAQLKTALPSEFAFLSSWYTKTL